MGYYLKSVLGIAVFLGSVVLFNVELVKLLEIGTCASGNTPFEIARPCPEGAGTAALLLTASVFGGFAGGILFAFRGDPPSGRRRNTGFGFGTLAWAVFFTSTGAVALWTSLSSEEVGPDGELGGAIVGGTFLLMGLPALLYVVWAAISDLRDGESAASTASSVGGFSTGGFTPDALAKFASGQRRMMGGSATRAPAGRGGGLEELERLQRLRESGALTDDEFERQKARILAEL